MRTADDVAAGDDLRRCAPAPAAGIGPATPHATTQHVLDAQADADAVARCAAGDERAFEGLYARHGGACLGLARQILVDGHYAEDAVQEAFLHLWRNAAAFDGTRASTRTWLIMLTRSRAIDRVRYEQRRRTLALDEANDRVDERPGPETQAITAALGRQTAAALAVLTPVQREALVLAYWGGYTQREIAAMTGTPLGTIKTRTCSALAALSRELHLQDDAWRDVVPR